MFKKKIAMVRLFVLKLDESVWGIFIGLAAGIVGSHLTNLASLNFFVGVTLLLASGSILFAVVSIVLKKKFQALVQNRINLKLSAANGRDEIVRSYLDIDVDEMVVAESNKELRYATTIGVLTFLLYIAATFYEYKADTISARLKDQCHHAQKVLD